MNKTCYMMVGIPASGKSTASEQLIKEIPNLEIVSTDIYIENYANKKGKTYNEVYREVGDEAQKWMNNRIKQLINEKKNFIWDQTNVFASARKKKLATLKQNKYETIAIVVEVSEEELQKRIEKRKNEGGKTIGWKIIRDMIENYTRPDYSEGFSEIYLIEDNLEPKLILKKDQKPIL